MRFGPIPLFAALAVGPIHAAIPDSPHPDFDLAEVPFPSKFKTMGIAFLGDGRMVLSTTSFVGGGQVEAAANPSVKVSLVSGYSGNPSATLRMEEISNTWLQLAGVVVAEGKVYVSDRDGFYEIQKLSAVDDLAKNRRLILKWPDEGTWPNGFQWHQFAFTPAYRNGYFYAPYSGSIRPGGPSDANPTSKMSGGFLKWDLAGKLEAIAGGLRSPNGMGVNEATGEMFVADNQGSWLPASTFSLMKAGRFYGHKQVHETRNSAGAVTATHPANWAEGLPYEPPVAWLPHGDVRASPSQPILIGQGNYAGDWLLGDVNNPGLIRIALDKVGEACNGAVFFFSKGTKNSAINRLAWGPDGALYLGTIATIAGNWPGGNDNAFYRMSPKSPAAAFEMRAVRSLADGLELEFTRPVDPATAMAANFTAEHWQYVRQPEYGIGRQPTVKLTVAGTAVSADGMRVQLRIPGLIRDRVVHVKHAGVLSAAGKPAWNDEAWFTLNAISTREWNAVAVQGREGREALPADGLKVLGGSRVFIEADIAVAGPWRATLFAPDGSVFARQTGSGASRIRFRAARAGMHILGLDTKDGSLMRKVAF